MKRLFLNLAALMLVACATSTLLADGVGGTAENSLTWEEFRLTNELNESANGQQSRPLSNSARLRLQRAVYRDQQRVARIEANAWRGYEPLRPGWSSVPMMSSRFPDRQTVIIPVFVP